jgi:low affinity Fe/Cu permease
MSWAIMILFGIAAIALIVFLIIQNRKDEKGFERQLKNDYRKTKEEEGDTEIDEIMK